MGGVLRSATSISSLGLTLSLVLLLDNGLLETLLLGEGDHWLVSFANDEHVVDSSREGVVKAILNAHGIEPTKVSLSVHNGSHSPSVDTTSHEAHIA